MKSCLTMLILSIVIFITSCKEKNEPLVACLDIYHPMVSNINYKDSNGKELIFADTPLYPAADIKIYKIDINDRETPLSFTINKESKFISINLDKVENGTFYIQLKSDVQDKITYTAKIDANDPCRDYKLQEIKQNDIIGQYDQKNQIWILKK